jgi:MoxR-like ATPase
VATATQISSLQKLLENLNTVLIGKEEAVSRTVTTLIARGHLLIEDVPGIGKTLLGLALAKSIKASFRRVQFTNDLLPSDILGVNIYKQKEGKFEFQPGPIFSHIILADEINRSTPKTQSALLEAMNERQVTVEGITHKLEEPFLVIATENPIEYHGTFPLPEAQLDRFFMRVQIGYPKPEDELAVLEGGDLQARLKDLEAVLSIEDVLELQQNVDAVRMDKELLAYVVEIAQHTRSADHVKLGLSPRGAQALCRSAKAHALTEGRDYVIPDDIKQTAVPVIAHRLVLDSSQYGLTRVAESENYVAEVLENIRAPQ